MPTAKRYYWLKLQEDFFSSKRIKKLRKIAGGDTYTIIYLKMQLLAMKNDGILEYTGLEQTFAEELALDLDEDPANVSVTVSYLLNCGLLETADNKEFFVPYAVLNTGSEGASAKRMRDHRNRKALQCDTNVTPMLQNGDGEKEIEKELEIEGDIRESTAGEPPSIPSDPPKHPKQPKPPEPVAHKRGEYGWVKLTDEQYNRLIQEKGLNVVTAAIRYVDESAQGNGNKNGWKDWNLVVRRCIREGWGQNRQNYGSPPPQRQGNGFHTSNPFMEMLNEERGKR